jgi:hypothetical protein
MMVYISITNYRMDLVVCKKNSLRMQIAQAIPYCNFPSMQGDGN